MTKAEKQALLDQLVSAVRVAHQNLVAAQAETQAGLVHEDSRAEGDKDMRSTEASYVARGQAMRVEALAAELALLGGMRARAFGAADAVAIGACVTLAQPDGEQRCVLLAPAGGGHTVIAADGRSFAVVTHKSPLGLAILGARQGDVLEFSRAGKSDELEVVTVE